MRGPSESIIGGCFQDMEWNTKWDWENLDIFGSKGVISPKKLQSTDWGIETEDMDWYFNLSGVVGQSGGSANSSAKSSVSASTESSLKGSMKASNFSFEGFGTSPLFEASASSCDQSIGSKLGKRTYFKNSVARSDAKTCSSSDIPVSIDKKAKSSCQSTPIPHCQVEGCNLDLSFVKEYHRKHRVCESHSKSLKAIVGGLERRFCQQCSRFHSLPEFDGKKRSCRRRLSDHNARRRKPQQDTTRFNPTSLSSSFYDGRQQLSFVFNNAPPVGTNSIWESTCNSKYSLAAVKAEKSGGVDGLTQFPHAFNKSTTANVFDQGLNETSVDIGCALSLLSNSSWGSDFVTLEQPNMHQHEMHMAVHATHFAESIPYNQTDENLKPL